MTRNAEAQPLSLGVLARSRKPDERRLPIHPAHFSRIDRRVRPRIFLEHGYGSEFGATDDALAELVGGIRTREQLIADCDVILLPKVQAEDLAELHAGQMVWGWPHCVQDSALTQIAIDRRLTLIAFEAMNHWQPDGGFGLHVFHKNNELAGYCSVLHAMQLAGITGSYGRRLRAAVIGFGATARGAVTALNAHGVDDVRVLTNRDVAAVAFADPLHPDNPDGARPGHARPDLGGHPGRACPGGPTSSPTTTSSSTVFCRIPTHRWSSSPRTTWPPSLPGSLIVDVSCDVGMGFGWARPDLVHAAHDRAWPTACTTTPWTTARPTCGTRRRGDQRGVVAAHRPGAGWACDVECDPDDLPGHRDPRRRRSQSQRSCRFRTATTPTRTQPSGRSIPAHRSRPWGGRRRRWRSPATCPG